MKYPIIILSLLFMTITRNSTAQSLDNYQWKNRIVLLVDANSDTNALKMQLAELNLDKKALELRDLIIFRVTPDAVYSSDGSTSNLSAKDIYENFGLDSNFRGTLLIGKDGGMKLKKHFKVSAQEIYDLIDSMPMRRQEMLESEGN